MCVSFKSTATVYPVLHHKDYTKEEWDATWYNSRECKKMKKSIQSDLRRMVHHKSSYPEKNGKKEKRRSSFCSRGLESYAEPGLTKKRQRRRVAIDSVLDIQALQRSKHGKLNDEKSIAVIYAGCSLESKQVARFMGIADERKAISSLSSKSTLNKEDHDTVDGNGDDDDGFDDIDSVHKHYQGEPLKENKDPKVSTLSPNPKPFLISSIHERIFHSRAA
jgi:hypothetical protein